MKAAFKDGVLVVPAGWRKLRRDRKEQIRTTDLVYEPVECEWRKTTTFHHHCTPRAYPQLTFIRREKSNESHPR